MVRWIPGDALAIYAFLVTISANTNTVLTYGGARLSYALDPNGPIVLRQPKWWPLAAGIGLTVVLVAAGWIAARHTPRAGQPGLMVRICLTTTTFLLWSLATPLNGWQLIRPLSRYPVLVATIALGAGVLFGPIAEAIMARQRHRRLSP